MYSKYIKISVFKYILPNVYVYRAYINYSLIIRIFKVLGISILWWMKRENI